MTSSPATSSSADVHRRSPRRLSRDVADDLRTRILGGEFPPGGKLPTENELGAAYGVSRVTVRTALQLLESRGLADIRHGSGTYVAQISGGIRAGLQELRSITETIRELGHEPSMRRRSLERRPCTATEAEPLGLVAGDGVWSVERSIHADGEIVAYSLDLIPGALIPADSNHARHLGEGSVFGTLQACGVAPARAVARVHAVDRTELTVPPDAAETGPGPTLYVLLDQLHETRHGEPVLHSRTYFVEGRFQFVILRTR